MNQDKQKLVIDGNAFYEVDLECIKKKKEKKEEKQKIKQQRQRK